MPEVPPWTHGAGQRSLACDICYLTSPPRIGWITRDSGTAMKPWYTLRESYPTLSYYSDRHVHKVCGINTTPKDPTPSSNMKMAVGEGLETSTQIMVLDYGGWWNSRVQFSYESVLCAIVDYPSPKSEPHISTIYMRDTTPHVYSSITILPNTHQSPVLPNFVEPASGPTISEPPFPETKQATYLSYIAC